MEQKKWGYHSDRDWKSFCRGIGDCTQIPSDEAEDTPANGNKH